MTTLREAAQQALEALEFVGEDMPHWAAVKRAQAITALRDALAQEEQPTRAQQMREAGYTRRPTLREMAQQEQEDIAQNLQSRLDAALLLEGRRQEIAQPRRETEQEPVAWTDRELELIDGMIEVQLRHAAQCDAIANRAMAEKQKGWDMERVALLRKIKSISPRREPEQEPVAWMLEDVDKRHFIFRAVKPVARGEWETLTPLYTHPPRREWRSLSEEEIIDAVRESDLDWQRGWTLEDSEPNRYTQLARAIEVALKEKNNG